MENPKLLTELTFPVSKESANQLDTMNQGVSQAPRMLTQKEKLRPTQPKETEVPQINFSSLVICDLPGRHL